MWEGLLFSSPPVSAGKLILYIAMLSRIRILILCPFFQIVYLQKKNMPKCCKSRRSSKIGVIFYYIWSGFGVMQIMFREEWVGKTENNKEKQEGLQS